MAPLEQFILFGDSITQGAWEQQRGFGLGAELQAAYVRVFDVINRGYSAYNTEHGLAVLEHTIPTPEQASVKFLTIWFGANDCNKELAHEQYVPIETFKQNLISIITHPLVTAQSPNIILLTNPPFEESVLWNTMLEFDWGGKSRKQVDAKAYSEITKEVGKEFAIPVIDVWSMFMEKTGWREGEELIGTVEKGKNDVLAGLLYDGIHLAPDGYRIVFDELVKVLKENWPAYPPYAMPFKVDVGMPWEIENARILRAAIDGGIEGFRCVESSKI